MPRVIISSGHTTSNPGVVFNGLQEYDLARKIAKYALKYIRLNGIISLSVPPNLELPQRISWINKTGYLRETNDIAIEIHINDGGKSGLEAWYEGEGENPSQGIAKIVTAGLSQETGLPIVGIHSEYTHELQSIAFVHELKPYSMVIECGYIDGDADFLKEEANLEKCGRGIAKGILNYFGLEYREVPVGQASLISNPQQQTPQQPAPQQQSLAAQQAPQQPMAQQFQAPQQPVAQPVQPNQQVVNSPAPTKTPTLKTQSDNYYDEEFDDYDDFDDYDWNKNPAPQQVQPNQIVKPPTTPVVNNQPQTANNALNSFANKPSYQQPVAANNGFNNQYAAPNGNKSSGAFPTREERKEMIIRNYQKLLGREPNQNDLNYFLNIGIKEDELIKKMVDSQEHLDLINGKEELVKIKESYSQDKAELEKLRALTEDQKTIMDQYNQAIDQKNTALGKLENDLRELQQKQHSEPKVAKKVSTAKSNYKGTFTDKFFKAISDLLE